MLSRVKHIAILFQLMLMGILVSGRESTKLFSMGNNLPWNQPYSWSLSLNGPACTLTPQSNDSLVINHTVLLNTDFTFSGFGNITILNSGVLRGNGFKLILTGNSSIFCQGEIQLSNISLYESSKLNCAASGKCTILSVFQNYSSFTSEENGILLVLGSLDCGGTNHPESRITGKGKISSVNYSGCGELMSCKPASSVIGGSVLSEVNWTGAVSSDWNDPLNWAGNKIPDASSNTAVLKTLNNPVISASVYSHSLFLSSNTSLTILPSAVLSVEGDLSIDPLAQLLLKNTTGEYASLITSGMVTGKVKSEMQVAGNTTVFISTPVKDALTGVFVYMYLRAFDESNASWGNYIIPTDVQLNPMQGYELYSAYGDTRYFEGTPNSGEFSQMVSSTNNGWNLIGNPYPSYIDWQSGSKSAEGWQRGAIGSAIYYPDRSGSGNYSVYIPGDDDASLNGGSRYIAPMQGFFVKARQSGVIKVNSQVIAPSVSKSVTALRNTALKFKVESSSLSDETVIRFNPASTTAFDDDYDAYKLSLKDDAPSIFTTVEDGTEMAINTMPDVSSSLQIPIGIRCNSEQELKLTVAGGANFTFRYPLTLEDKVEKKYIDLRFDSTYTFHYSPSTGTDRFRLYFDVASGTSDNLAEGPVICSSNGNILIKGMENQKYTVIICSVDGKEILQTSNNLSTVMTIPFQGYHGIYLVKIQTNTTCHARKLYLE